MPFTLADHPDGFDREVERDVRVNAILDALHFDDSRDVMQKYRDLLRSVRYRFHMIVSTGATITAVQLARHQRLLESVIAFGVSVYAICQAGNPEDKYEKPDRSIGTASIEGLVESLLATEQIVYE